MGVIIFSFMLTVVSVSNSAAAEQVGPLAPLPPEVTAADADSPPATPFRNLIGPYTVERAVLWSALSTGLAIAVGGGLIAGGVVADIDGLTWGGVGVISAGIVVGPSLGHLYAQNRRGGFVTMGLRFIFVLAAVLPQIIFHFADDSESSALRAHVNLVYVVPLISVSALAAVIRDILTVPRSVHRANAAYRIRMGL